MANGQFFSGLVRLYHATFDRTSDIEGIGYWARQLAKGEIVFAEVAAAFMASDEFAELYPDGLSDEEFVTLLYQNVLKREPDNEGKAYWLKVLDEGNLRSEVLMGFADSDEFIEDSGEELEEELSAAEQEELRILAEIESDDDDSDDDDSDDDDSENDEGGVEPDAFSEEEYEAFVANLYDAAFNREADSPGLGYWVSQLAQNKLDLSGVAAAFMASDEFVELYGHGLGDDEFIGALYHNVLERGPDADGQAYGLGQLVGGMARYDVLEAFANSAENTGSGDADSELEVVGTIGGDDLIV